MKLAKEIFTSQHHILVEPKRRRRCNQQCQQHTFQLFGEQKNHKHHNIKMNFCPKYQRGNLPPENTYPSYNYDRLYYTSAFVLGIDKKQLQLLQKQELIEHNRVIRDTLQKNCRVLFPMPNPKHILCSVCKINYYNYYTHIMSDYHKQCIKNNKFYEDILTLTELFQDQHPKGQQIASPFIAIKYNFKNKNRKTDELVTNDQTKQQQHDSSESLTQSFDDLPSKNIQLPQKLPNYQVQHANHEHQQLKPQEINDNKKMDENNGQNLNGIYKEEQVMPINDQAKSTYENIDINRKKGKRGRKPGRPKISISKFAKQNSQSQIQEDAAYSPWSGNRTINIKHRKKSQKRIQKSQLSGQQNISLNNTIKINKTSSSNAFSSQEAKETINHKDNNNKITKFKANLNFARLLQRKRSKIKQNLEEQEIKIQKYTMQQTSPKENISQNTKVNIEYTNTQQFEQHQTTSRQLDQIKQSNIIASNQQTVNQANHNTDINNYVQNSSLSLDKSRQQSYKSRQEDQQQQRSALRKILNSQTNERKQSQMKEGNESQVNEGKQSQMKEGKQSQMKEGKQSQVNEGKKSQMIEGKESQVKEGSKCQVKEGSQSQVKEGNMVERNQLLINNRELTKKMILEQLKAKLIAKSNIKIINQMTNIPNILLKQCEFNNIQSNANPNLHTFQTQQIKKKDTKDYQSNSNNSINIDSQKPFITKSCLLNKTRNVQIVIIEDDSHDDEMIRLKQQRRRFEPLQLNKHNYKVKINNKRNIIKQTKQPSKQIFIKRNYYKPNNIVRLQGQHRQEERYQNVLYNMGGNGDGIYENVNVEYYEDKQFKTASNDQALEQIDELDSNLPQNLNIFLQQIFK